MPDRSQRPQSPEEPVLQKGEKETKDKTAALGRPVGGQEKEEMEQDEELRKARARRERARTATRERRPTPRQTRRAQAASSAAGRRGSE